MDATSESEEESLSISLSEVPISKITSSRSESLYSSSVSEVFTMPSLDRQLFHLWICIFIFGLTLLACVQSAQSTPFLGKTEISTRTPAATSLPFGARLSGSYQIDQNKHLRDSKNISFFQNSRNPNGSLVLNKSLQLSGGSLVHNSSVGSTNVKSNRVMKKIKSKRRRIHPNRRNNRKGLQTSNRKFIPIREMNNFTLQIKHVSGFSSQGNVFQNDTGNRRSNKINSFDVSGDSRHRDVDDIQEKQRSRVFDMHRNSRTDSIVKVNMSAQNNTTLKNKYGLQEISRNRLEPSAINRRNKHGHTVIVHLTPTTQKEAKAVDLSANGRNGNIVTNVNVSWSIDLLGSLRNRTVSLSRNIFAVPIDIQFTNTSLFQHGNPLLQHGNMEQYARSRITGLSDDRSTNENLKKGFVPNTLSYSRNPVSFVSPTKPYTRNRIHVLSDEVSSNNKAKEGFAPSTKSHSENRVTAPMKYQSLNKSVLPEKLGNPAQNSADAPRMLILSGNRSGYNSLTDKFRLSTESYAGHKVTTPRAIQSLNKNIQTDKNGNLNGGQQNRSRMTVSSTNIPSSSTLPTFINKIQSRKPENYVRLDQTRKVTVIPETSISNKDIPNVKDSSYHNYFNVSPDHTKSLLQDFMRERHNSQVNIIASNNATILSGKNNINGNLTKVKKDHSPFHFPHSKEKVEDKSNIDAKSSKQKLPCPCYWSKEKCGCSCTGSLNYDDFQILASYFKPCLNFTFTLKEGHYFSLPPNLFTRASPLQNIIIKISNSTFDYLFDPTPNTSPFRKLVVEQEGIFDIFNVKVRQSWNWASLKDLKVSSGAMVLHNDTVKLANDLSSSESTAIQILKDIKTPGSVALLNGTTKLLKDEKTSESTLFPNGSSKLLKDLKSSVSKELKSRPSKMPKSHVPLNHGASAINVVLVGCDGLKRLSSDFAEVANGGVSELTISDGGLEMIGSGAFTSFNGLVRFRLSRNRLRSIKRTDLPPDPTELVEIDLSGNQLQTLDDDFFLDMPALRDLSLAGNPLHTLGQKTFGTVLGKMQLQGLDAFPLHCDCRLRWMKSSSQALSPVFVENLRGVTCKRPAYLRGTPFRDLAIEHLKC
ncbi:hypothetical protein JTE90_004285 [Oedothorax gibbosus]|uniref:LRRCT domain-containing protein n=1 Tax=Oedothorax gibbosus TaxID=931172 RepID=A0AAV6VMR1_9ARAC|nr:hypothetical protein JTE90_004285 [Oedothorax gibbosus]